MIVFRGILAVATLGVGAVLLVRMLASGLHPEILTGVVLACAMIALGLHNLRLVLRARDIV